MFIKYIRINYPTYMLKKDEKSVYNSILLSLEGSLQNAIDTYLDPFTLI